MKTAVSYLHSAVSPDKKNWKNGDEKNWRKGFDSPILRFPDSPFLDHFG